MSAPSLATRALDLLGSEWTKFRSVRSTYWSLLVAVVTPIAVSAVVAFAFASAPGHGPPPDPLLPGVISLEYAVIAVSVLGVLAFSAEYSTGLIHVTFTAAPRRRAVLAAKAVVLAAVTLAAGEVVAFVSFGLVQAVLAGHGQGVSLGHPGVPGAVLCAGLLLRMRAARPGPRRDHPAHRGRHRRHHRGDPGARHRGPAAGPVERPDRPVHAARGGPAGERAAPGGGPVLPGLVPAGPAGLAGGRPGRGRVVITRRDA